MASTPSNSDDMYHTRLIQLVAWASLTWACLAIWPATAAHAQTSKQDYKRAQSLFLQGRKLVVQKQFKPALKRYADAILLLKSAINSATSEQEKSKYRNARAGMLYIVGRTYQLDKQPASAYRAYLRCRNARPAPKLAQIVSQFLARLRPQVIATLELTTLPAGVRIRITDAVGQTQNRTTPLSEQITPGTTQLFLQYPGYRSQTLRLTLAPRSRTSRTITMQRIRQKIAPPKPTPTNGAAVGMWVSIGVASVAAIAGISLLAVGIPQEQSGLVCYGQSTKPECANQTDTTIADAVEGGQTLKFVGIGVLVVGGLAAGAAIFFHTQRTPTPRTATRIQHTSRTHATTFRLHD